tara:strand:+ start:915 stop:2078 length:1164 start_codon:yes stop_codon:yes gene_type:complete
MFTARTTRIQPSATLEMTAKAAELRAKGVDVINLSVGEPDFPTPKNIREAGIFGIENGHTRYTAGSGTPDLKNAIIKKLSRDNNLDFSPKQVMVSCGGKHALYNACQVLFEQGDEVIIFSPYWVSFPDFVSVTGAKPIFVNTNPERQFEPVFNDLEEKITKRTKGIIINSPSNPTGGVWSDDAIKRTLEIAIDNDLWIFSDECYEQLTYDMPFKSSATFSNNSKIITFQSCSKTYAMTGWRIGYTAGDKGLIKAMSKLQSQSTSCPTAISQYAAIEALTGPQDMIETMKAKFKKRRDYFVEALNNIDGITCSSPGGAFYVFPNIEGLMKNYGYDSPSSFSLSLLESEAIVSVSGESFGSNSCIRFSYATSKNELERAIVKIKNFLKK